MPVLSTAEEARAFVLAKPAGADGYHNANFLLTSYRIDADGEEIVPLMVISIGAGEVSGYLQCCDNVKYRGRLVDGSNVTTQVLCDDLPCAVGTTDYASALSYLKEFIDAIASDVYGIDEFICDVRSYESGARVDAIIDI